MPIELTAAGTDQAGDFSEDVLFTDKGRLTLVSEVLASFLASVDWTPLLDHPDARQFVEVGPVIVAETEDGDLVPLMDDDEDDREDAAGFTIVEYMDGEIAAEFVDEADLESMFEHYVRNEYPADTLEDRTALQQFDDVIDDEVDPLDEKFKAPFRKGDFRKGPMKGVSPVSKGNKKKVYNQRVRMMVAMLKKGVITRVPKGSGYKKGDYKKGPGYGGGTASGKKAYANASVKDARTASKITGYVDPGRRSVVKVIFKNIGKSMPKNWVPPEKRGKYVAKGKVAVKKVGIKKDTTSAVAAGKNVVAGKAKSLFAKKAPGSHVNPFKKGKQADVAHDSGASFALHEGAGLAGAVLRVGRHKAAPIASPALRAVNG